jgi:hypothetical protein
MTPLLVRRLTLGLAAVYAALGTLEVVLKVAGDSTVTTIAFFGGTLLGGAGLILYGLFAHLASSTRRVLIILGAVAGLLASAWTLLVPVLAIAVIALNATRPVAPAGEDHQP